MCKTIDSFDVSIFFTTAYRVTYCDLLCFLLTSYIPSCANNSSTFSEQIRLSTSLPEKLLICSLKVDELLAHEGIFAILRSYIFLPPT
jgi:hypothetical protein